MAKMRVVCAFCGNEFDKEIGHVNRARRVGAPIYCNRKCSGQARQILRDEDEWKRKKAEYDRVYREANREKRKRRNAEWYQRTVDREKERAFRQANMPRHVEYCRRPEYKRKKKDYDQQKCDAQYAEFAEAARVLLELEREIRRRVPSKYERLKARGYFTTERVRERKRKWQSQERRECLALKSPPQPA